MGDEIHDKPKMLTVLPPNAHTIFKKRARKIVCDEAWNEQTKEMEIVGFRFNPAIANWPICRAAEAEGWASDLRQQMISTLYQMMFHGQEPDPERAVKMVLGSKMSGSNKTWEETTREHAKRYALAKEWRDRVCEEYGDMDRFMKTKRPPGNAMQGNGAKASRMVAPGGFKSLSNVSLRMTGEAE